MSPRSHETVLHLDYLAGNEKNLPSEKFEKNEKQRLNHVLPQPDFRHVPLALLIHPETHVGIYLHPWYLPPLMAAPMPRHSCGFLTVLGLIGHVVSPRRHP